MGTPWGMINARREAEQHRHDAWQAHENEKILCQSLVSLIAAAEEAFKDLQKVPKSETVREKLRKAIDNALKTTTPK